MVDAVSIHAPAREATQRRRRLRSLGRLFQSTPPRGKRRARRTATLCAMSSFNPRPRAGSDQSASSRARARGFNPRPRAGSDAHQLPIADTLEWFQSTPPRGEATWWKTIIVMRLVSIHAPAREATCMAAMAAVWASSEFQSTPPRGKRRARCAGAGRRGTGFNPRPRAGSDVALPRADVLPASFNPRPRAGSDLVGQRLRLARDAVSIHAPAREATWSRSSMSATPRFQSTPPRGKRHHGGVDLRTLQRFQSTPPRGKRPDYDWSVSTGVQVFQSTPPAREATWPKAGRYRLRSPFQIHAPAREAT